MTNSSSTTTQSLRICCYGSSRHETPEQYLKEAYLLGKTLAERGHTCVNGGGAYGCMGSMNQGVLDYDGSVIGVAHKMFISKDERDTHWLESFHPVFSLDRSSHENKSEFILVGGNDLQIRKRTLVKGADALIVLPGGPGTFDEVWEMVCSRQIGLIDMPIVCVNVDGFYDSFSQILERAHQEKFLYKDPRDLLHFEPTSDKAVAYIEEFIKSSNKRNNQGANVVDTSKTIRQTLERKPSLLTSFYNLPFSFTSFGEESDSEGEGYDEYENEEKKNGFRIDGRASFLHLATFVVGVMVGLRYQVVRQK
jgi:uncharacterized protein (TIGR00730 family)